MSHIGKGTALEDLSALVERLRGRRSEIAQTIFNHVRAVSDPGGDAEYLEGLHLTVTAVVDYGLAGIAHGEAWSGPIPSIAVMQAQLAARNGVGLETVWLRYTVGHRQLERFVMAEGDDFPNAVLLHVLEIQWSMLERLITAIATAYNREVERVRGSLEQRRMARVQRLLAGESIDLPEFDYKFDDAWHRGVIITGSSARETARCLAAGADRQLLSVSRSENTVWAWLGGDEVAVGDVDFLSVTASATEVVLAIGEPCRGVGGWRLTHHQAQAALLVGLRKLQAITHYVDDMLLAAALQNETLASSLEEVYLLPLTRERDGGVASRATLCAYFDAQRNAATAAHAIGQHRHTVERRVRAIEKRIGRLLHTCEAEMRVALCLHDLNVARRAVNPLSMQPSPKASETHAQR